ncbi:MAG: signal transduction protein [Pseudomonadota bacterium]
MQKHSLILAALLTLGLSVPASAQLAGPGFARADTNGDGAISRTEAQELRKAMFARLDRDSNGVVTVAERDAARARIAAMAQMVDSAMVMRTQRMDTDGDGLLSLAEFMEESPMFDLADRDGDGQITQAEADRLRGLMAARRQ